MSNNKQVRVENIVRDKILREKLIAEYQKSSDVNITSKQRYENCANLAKCSLNTVIISLGVIGFPVSKFYQEKVDKKVQYMKKQDASVKLNKSSYLDDIA